MKYVLNNRVVIDVELDGALAAAGYWEDTNQPLTDGELDSLTERYSTEIAERAWSNRACDLYDGYKASRWG